MIDGRSSMPMLGASLPPVLMAAIAFALLSGGGGESRRQVETVAALAQAGTATAAPAAAKAEATPSSAGEVALTAAALDVALSTSLTAQTVDAYLADAGCKAGAAAVVTAAARPPAAAWQASGTEVPCSLSAVIVTLADYEDSNSRWQSDRSLATVQSAMGAAGYTLERFFLPGAGSDANVKRGGDARRDPGVLLFRRLSTEPPGALREAAAGGAAVEVLVVLTVPEMPTSGIERLPLLTAAHLALTLHAVPHPDGPAHAQALRIIGPSYSGSSLSLLRALEEMALLEGEREERRGLQVQVVSGSATSASNCAILKGPLAHDGYVDFTRTVHEDDTLLQAMRAHLATIRPEWGSGRGVAILVESTTGWGASLAKQPGTGTAARPATARREEIATTGAQRGEDCGAPSGVGDVFPDALRLGFPLHIADRYASRQRSTPGLPQYAQLMAPTEVLRLDDSITPTDRLPTFTPFITNAARDLTLTGILAQLKRHRIGAVGILGTDIRDHLFLAREINHVVPDVIMFGTEPDILMLHPEYQPYVRGTLMASSYPLQGHVQTLTNHATARTRRVQFTSMAQQGLYNALVQIAAEYDDYKRLLVDYGVPDSSWFPGAGAECQRLRRPVPWVLVAGQREFVPVSVHPDIISPQDCLLIPVMMREERVAASTTSHGQDEQEQYLFASRQERFMWMLLPLVAALLIGLGALARWRPLPSGRWLSPPTPLDCRAPTLAFAPRRTSEWATLRAEHAIFSLAAGVALSLFSAWQVHVWHDVFRASSRAHAVTEVLSWAFSALSVGGAGLMLVLAARRVVVVAQSRGSHRARTATLVRRALATSAPEMVTLCIVALGCWFVGAMVWYLWHEHDGAPANQLFAAARSFDVTNLLSGAPMLAMFPAMVLVWTMWSLRTLYYQRISPTCASPLVHALVSLDAKDRRLEQALRSTLGTTMQPAGAYLLLPVVVLLIVVLLLEPRLASFEGHAFGRVLLIGSTLAAMAVSLELGQAAWLSHRVVRLLHRVRIHPVGAHVEAMEREPLDWRPTLAPAQSPHRLLLRGLRALGYTPAEEPSTLLAQEKLPLLRTHAWHEALWVAGRRLARSNASGLALGPEESWLAALVISVLLQSLVTRVVRGFGIAVLLSLMLLVGHLLTAFSGRGLALMLDVGLIIVAAFFAIRALLILERDHVLSKLWRGTPGSLNLNSGLVWRAVVYAGLPLLTVISVRFPEIGGRLVTVVEPLRHMLPMP